MPEVGRKNGYSCLGGWRAAVHRAGDATGLRYGHIVTVEWWCLAIDAPPIDSNGAADNQHGTARGSGVHSPAAKADVRRFTMHGICEPPARVTNRTEHGNWAEWEQAELNEAKPMIQIQVLIKNVHIFWIQIFILNCITVVLQTAIQERDGLASHRATRAKAKLAAGDLWRRSGQPAAGIGSRAGVKTSRSASTEAMKAWQAEGRGEKMIRFKY